MLPSHTLTLTRFNAHSQTGGRDRDSRDDRGGRDRDSRRDDRDRYVSTSRIVIILSKTSCHRLEYATPGSLTSSVSYMYK